VVRPLRDPSGPFQKLLLNGDVVSPEDLMLDVLRSVPAAPPALEFFSE
jgi:hypothetical protein